MNISQEDWDKNWNIVYAYFYRRVNNQSQVEELTSETLNDYYLSETDIQNPKAYLFTIARNKLVKFIKTKQSITLPINEEQEQLLTSNADLEYSSHYKKRMQKLIECMRHNLKPEELEILEMSVISDFSSKAIATKFNLTSSNIRQKVSRGLKKIRNKCTQIWKKYE